MKKQTPEQLQEISLRLYRLGMHEEGVAHDGSLFTTALRVPGGWIYRSYDKEHQILGSTFVPWNNEFQPTLEDNHEF